VLFATLHVFGSGNNAAKSGEYQARNAATVSQLQSAFATAKKQGFRGVMLIMQANPGFEKINHTGWSSRRTTLRAAP
jgi:hypothetical protein